VVVRPVVEVVRSRRSVVEVVRSRRSVVLREVVVCVVVAFVFASALSFCFL
jgi:hypothetical protein